MLEGMGTVVGRCERMESLAIGQKDLSRLPARAVRGRAPLALAHPSARGFGVDGGKCAREWRRAEVGQFSRTSPDKVVLVWCCGEKSGPKRLKFSEGENKEKAFHSNPFKAFSNSGKSP